MRQAGETPGLPSESIGAGMVTMHGRARRLSVVPRVDGEFRAFMCAIRGVYGGRGETGG